MDPLLQQIAQLAETLRKFTDHVDNLINTVPQAQTPLKTPYVNYLNNQITQLQSLSSQIAALP